MAAAKEKPVRILLLWGDLYGANCTMGGKKLSILDKFRGYGWDLTSAGVKKRVSPCAFAAKRGQTPIELDCTVSEIDDVTTYDGISILPGPRFDGLMESPDALRLVRRASKGGLVVSGWCRGVRVLAAADVIRGKRVVCHADDRGFIEAAGGIYVGHDHPPVTDGLLVTGARSYYYRTKNAEAIRTAIVHRASPDE